MRVSTVPTRTTAESTAAVPAGAPTSSTGTPNGAPARTHVAGATAHAPAPATDPTAAILDIIDSPASPMQTDCTAPDIRSTQAFPTLKPTDSSSPPYLSSADLSPVSAIPIESLTSPHPKTPAKPPMPAYSDFSVTKATPDGLCIIHSFISSAQYQIGGDAYNLTVDSVRDKVWDHCQTNYDIYINAVTHSTKAEFLENLYEYLFKAHQKSNYLLPIVDLIPHMLSNIFNIGIIIFDDSTQRSTNAYDVENNPQVLLFIRKIGNHYDGLVPKPRQIGPHF